MKKIAVFLFVPMFIFCFSACSPISETKNMIKDYFEQFEPIENMPVYEDKNIFTKDIKNNDKYSTTEVKNHNT